MSLPSPSFNLLTQPWLPCLPLDGDAPIMLSLPDALAGAHHYRELVADSPLVRVALHRLLLAVIHRTYMGPRNADEWHALWNCRRFDAERVGAYLLDPRWSTHFDLFDADRPFYQMPAAEETKPISVAKLAIERASGNNVTLFDHTVAASAAFTPAEAARNLAGFQLYAMGGGVSDSPVHFYDGPLARDYTVLLYGTSLFETLMLNLLYYYDDAPPFSRPLSEDSAWWERDRDPDRDVEKGTMPRGYCDYLTWQSRRVHLAYDANAEAIRLCQVRQNLRLSPSLVAPDPFKSYRNNDKRGLVAQRLKEAKAIWRDSHTLLEEARNDGNRPEIFAWLGTLFPVRGRSSARSFVFEITGYRTDGPQGPVILWRHERLPLPLSYLSPEGKPLRDELSSALQVAEGVGRLFGTGSFSVTVKSGKTTHVFSPAWVLAKELLTMNPERTLSKQRKQDVVALINHFAAERTYWAQMEPPFRRLMVALAEDPAMNQSREQHFDAVLCSWKEEIRSIAWRTFTEFVSALESDTRSLRAAAIAQSRFNWLLRELLPVPQQEFALAGARQQTEAHQ